MSETAQGPRGLGATGATCASLPSRPQCACRFSNIAATTAAFVVEGGTYVLGIVASFGRGNVQAQVLAFDGVTWVNVGSAITMNSVVNFTLPPGQYRLQVNGNTTAIYATLTRIPA